MIWPTPGGSVLVAWRGDVSLECRRTLADVVQLAGGPCCLTPTERGSEGRRSSANRG
jgi:hypothetical protein